MIVLAAKQLTKNTAIVTLAAKQLNTEVDAIERWFY
jgi:hypothetical protein